MSDAADKIGPLADYLDAKRRAFVNMRGHYYSELALDVIAQDWPGITVAELCRGRDLLNETRRARRRIEKGQRLQ